MAEDKGGFWYLSLLLGGIGWYGGLWSPYPNKFSLVSRCAILTVAFVLLSSRSVGHVFKRTTEHLKVSYYVGDSFAEEYTGTNLKNVERSVEDDYIANLRNNCWKEKQQSE